MSGLTDVTSTNYHRSCELALVNTPYCVGAVCFTVGAYFGVLKVGCFGGAVVLRCSLMLPYYLHNYYYTCHYFLWVDQFGMCCFNRPRPPKISFFHSYHILSMAVFCGLKQPIPAGGEPEYPRGPEFTTPSDE